MRPILAVTDSPYFTSILVAAVSVLFGVVGKVALELLKRTDASHAREIALYQLWLEEERKRGDQWRALAHAEKDVTTTAVEIAAKKVP